MTVCKVLKSFQDVQHKLLLNIIFMQIGVTAGSFSYSFFVASSLWFESMHCCCLVMKRVGTSIWAAASTSNHFCKCFHSDIQYTMSKTSLSICCWNSQRQSSLIGFRVLRHLTVLWPCSPTPWPQLTGKKRPRTAGPRGHSFGFVVVTAKSTQWWGEKPDRGFDRPINMVEAWQRFTTRYKNCE